MIRIVRYPLALLVAIGWLIAGAGLAHAEDVLTFPGGTTADVARDAPTEAVFPAALGATVQTAEVKLNVVRISRDGYTSSTLTSALKAEWAAATPAVVLTLADPAPQPGAYAVTIRITAGQASQFTTFTLTRAGADVSVPAAVTVTRDEPLLWSKESVSAPSLSIRCGRNDALTSVSAWQNEADTGTVVVDPVDASKCTNAAVQLKYRLDGDFPLGTSTRTLTVDSPQLSAPKTVTFTIVNRRPTWLIPVLVLLGLAVGVGSRTLLVPALAKLRSKAALREAVDRVTAAKNAAKDALYLDALQKALDDHSGVGAIATPEKIDAQTAALLKTADAAHEELTARLATVRDGLATKAEEVDRPWTLPESSADARALAATALAEVRARLAELDAQSANTVLNAADEAIKAFHAQVQGDLLDLKGDLAPIGQTFSATATGDAGTLRLLADRLDAALADGTTARARLETLSWLTQLSETLVSATQGVLAAAITPLRVGGQGGAADAVETTSNRAPHPATLAAAARWAGASVTTLVATLMALPAALKDQVTAGLARGDIRAAVSAAIGSTSLGPDQPAPSEPMPEQTLTAPPGRETDETGLVPVPGGFGTLPPPIGVLQTTSRLLALGQFVLLGLVLIVVALALYEKDWVGTWTQMVTVLTWAAAIDMTTAAVLAAAKPTPTS